MKGYELYKHLFKRDYSMSEADRYAQALGIIRYHAMIHNYVEEFYLLLEKAEKQGKKIEIEAPFDENVLYDDILFEDLILV